MSSREDAWVRAILEMDARGGEDRAELLVGNGDDAAVLAEGTALSVDVAVEGTHFLRSWARAHGWRAIGARAAEVALSDLAAMGATPRGVLSSLILPREIEEAAVLAIADGIRAAAARVGTGVIGGNLARGDQVSISTTVIGHCVRPLRRDAVREGDIIYLSKSPNLTCIGLNQLLSGDLQGAHVGAWLGVKAQIDAGLQLAEFAHAAIDLSDGLAADAQKLAAASGVEIALDAEALRGLEGAEEARALGLDPIATALGAVGSCALLFSAEASAEAERVGAPIGRARRADRAGLVLCGEEEQPITADAFSHFGP